MNRFIFELKISNFLNKEVFDLRFIPQEKFFGFGEFKD